MSYSVAPGPNYTVTAEGHGRGIVKVDFTTCVAAGQAVSLPMSVTPSGSGSASLKVIKEEGPGSLALSPTTTTFVAGQAQSFTVTLTPDGSAPGNGPAYRFKLAASPGSGLGEGPGVMVRFPCVLASGTPCGSAATTASEPPAGGAAAASDHGAAGDGEDQAGNDEPAICTPARGQAPVCPASSSTGPHGDGVAGLPPGQQGKKSKGGRGRGHGAHASKAGGNGKGRGVGDAGSSHGNGNGAGAPSATPQAPADSGNCAPLGSAAPLSTAPASTTVAAAPPSAPTFGRFGVLGTQQTSGAAACLAVPRRLRVHAGETSLITVAVKASGQRIQGALVRVLAPGVRIVKRTDRSGTLAFRVTPGRTGRLIIQSDVCFGAVKSTVLAARRSTRVAPPAFTG